MMELTRSGWPCALCCLTIWIPETYPEVRVAGAIFYCSETSLCNPAVAFRCSYLLYLERSLLALLIQLVSDIPDNAWRQNRFSVRHCLSCLSESETGCVYDGMCGAVERSGVRRTNKTDV